MNKSRKAVIIVFVIGMSIFGYSQYASASQIGVIITESDLIEKTEKGSSYNVELEFENPSLLILTAGETDFIVIADGKTIGEGKLEPFTLPALGSTLTSGSFQTEPNTESQEVPIVKISGITKYDILFSTLDVPFVFYPTEEQAREFIHQD
ncbi:MAG: hypothetical protein OES14_00755 [Nitrosopumilus sp.]|nr:hypothetical protein [Nitrosopumilus sp.]MDH3824305.1 hypothetical protein [Nitrosopumilus sp.]